MGSRQIVAVLLRHIQGSLGWHPANPGDVVAAVNVGGVIESIAIGDIWYEANTYVSATASRTVAEVVLGASGSEVYQRAGVGDIAIDIPVNGNKTLSVALSFVEFLYSEPGKRLMNVEIEGQSIFNDLDIYAEAGHDTLWQPEPINVTVTDGSLTIRIVGTEDDATLSSVLVREIASGDVSNTKAGSVGGYFLLVFAGLFCFGLRRSMLRRIAEISRASADLLLI